MFKRKLYAKMLDWKESSAGSSALLLEGARRVGKTTLAKQFAEQEYESSLYIDFSIANRDVLDIFSDHSDDVDTLLRMLQLYYGKQLARRKSVLIFDEVQNFSKARELIKHLVADGRFDYIETGSLISIKKNVAGIVIPSEEDRLTLHPMDFEEYLWAGGDELLPDAIRDAFSKNEPLHDAIHKKAERLFDEYMLVGGMPQAVQAFVEDKDFVRCDRIKRRILALYGEDMEKFSGADGRRAYSVFQEIPEQLSRGSKRFKFTSLGNSARYREYESAIRWLEDSHLVNICRKCNDPNIAFKMTAEDSSLKCYMADTGLLVSLAFADDSASMEAYRSIQLGKVSINRGMIAENVVAQQLRANGHALFYYDWKEKPNSSKGVSGGGKMRPREIDFLIIQKYKNAANKLRVSPIEVKSGRSYSTISLDDFSKKFKDRVGCEYVLHPRQLQKSGDRIACPLYMSLCL